MKTKNEYLQDLEFSLSEISIGISDKDLKQQYRKLTLKYNTDQGTEKNLEKHILINEAFSAIEDNKFKIEEIILTPEIATEHYTKAMFDFLDQGAIIIDLKNSDNKLILIDNVLINFDCSQLTKDKFVLINRCRLFKFQRSKK